VGFVALGVAVLSLDPLGELRDDPPGVPFMAVSVGVLVTTCVSAGVELGF